MKYLLILLLAIGSHAQDIKNFVIVGKAEGNIYLVDPINVKGKGENVVFIALAGKSLGLDGDKEVVDVSHYAFTVFEANCKSYAYTPINVYGVLDGKKFEAKPERLTKTAKEPQVIWFAIQMVCKQSKLFEV